jgi:hypothetical protein
MAAYGFGTCCSCVNLRLLEKELLTERRFSMKKIAVTLGVVLGAAVVGLGIHKWRK